MYPTNFLKLASSHNDYFYFWYLKCILMPLSFCFYFLMQDFYCNVIVLCSCYLNKRSEYLFHPRYSNCACTDIDAHISWVWFWYFPSFGSWCQSVINTVGGWSIATERKAQRWVRTFVHDMNRAIVVCGLFSFLLSGQNSLKVWWDWWKECKTRLNVFICDCELVAVPKPSFS